MNIAACTSHCKEPLSTSSISFPNRVVDTRSSTISHGRVRAVIYTRPTGLRLLILLLVTRYRYFIRAWTTGMHTSVGMGIALSGKHRLAEQPLPHLISISLDAYRFVKLKSSSHSSRHTVLTEKLTCLGEIVGETERT